MEGFIADYNQYAVLYNGRFGRPRGVSSVSNWLFTGYFSVDNIAPLLEGRIEAELQSVRWPVSTAYSWTYHSLVPFHPLRLWVSLDRSAAIRQLSQSFYARGIFWLSTRPQMVGSLCKVDASYTFMCGSTWLAVHYDDPSAAPAAPGPPAPPHPTRAP